MRKKLGLRNNFLTSQMDTHCTRSGKEKERYRGDEKRRQIQTEIQTHV